jgi:thiol-disulfide isomerase/thioredoxin
MSHTNSIIHLTDTKTFKDFINNKKTANQLYVIDFHAKWCKPCKKVSPLYDKLCNECSNVVYFKCDVDEADELAEVFEVRSVPTFIFAYNRTILEKMEGANITNIQNKINELINASDRKYTLLEDADTGEDADAGEDAVDEEDDAEEEDDDDAVDEDDAVEEDAEEEDEDAEEEDEDAEEDAEEDDEEEAEDDDEDDANGNEDGAVKEADDGDEEDLSIDDLSVDDLKELLEEISTENMELREENDRLTDILNKIKKSFNI